MVPLDVVRIELQEQLGVACYILLHLLGCAGLAQVIWILAV